jgi:hypothetical protein
MDKLYFCVQRTNALLTESREELTAAFEGPAGELSSRVDEFLDGELERKEKEKDQPSDEAEGDGDDASVLSVVDDASDDEEEGVAPTPVTTMYQSIATAWHKRQGALVHDYAIAGWLLSPVQEIRADVASNMTMDVRKALERVTLKLLGYASTKKQQGEMLNTLWAQYEHFQNKTGHYASRDHIWSSPDLERGDSHVWHRKNTLPGYTVLGKVACIVCSKILGIGSAERAWGNVKHLKTDKRAHLGGNTTKMQATMYGNHCRMKAQIKRDAKNPKSKEKFWDEEDFQTMGLTKFGVPPEDLITSAAKVQGARLFRAFPEAWEKQHLKKEKDVVAEQGFLEKYGGKRWFDTDDEIWVVADDERLEYSHKAPDIGWCVRALHQNYHKDDNPDAYKLRLCWQFDLCEAIGEYYQSHPEEGVTVIEYGGKFDQQNKLRAKRKQAPKNPKQKPAAKKPKQRRVQEETSDEDSDAIRAKWKKREEEKQQKAKQPIETVNLLGQKSSSESDSDNS